MSSEDNLPDIDWRRGSVSICNGRIYVSPNCKRTHITLPEPSTSLSSPFTARGPNQLTVHDFKDPVWWNNSWGWIGFMPLSPSFLSRPFESLSWRPKICTVAVVKADGSSETRYEVPNDTSLSWKRAEERILEACSTIRLSHTIPGELPPLPSELGFLRHHASQNIAKRQAETARDWFVIWMGFLSYLIVMAQDHPHYKLPNPSDSQTVRWYACLQEKEFPPSWLEGLAKSLVCRFDEDVPRVGVVMRLSDTSTKHRPSVAWLIKHHIPVWFILDAEEESWLRRQRYLSKLLPAQEMINDALSLYFRNLSAEVKAIVIIYYLNTTHKDVAVAMEKVLRVKDLGLQTFQFCLQAVTPSELAKMPQLATSEDSDAVLGRLRQQLAVHEGSLRADAKKVHYPWPQMLDKEDLQDTRLYETWEEFFDQRAKLHAEMESSESDRNRQRRLARDRNRARKKCVVYQWKQVNNDGKILYARIRISHKRQEGVLNSFLKKDHTTRKFNAFADPPEWDLYEHFARDKSATTLDPESDVSDSDIEFGSPPKDFSPPASGSAIPQSPSVFPPTPSHFQEVYGPQYFTPQSPPPLSNEWGFFSPSQQLPQPSSLNNVVERPPSPRRNALGPMVVEEVSKLSTASQPMPLSPARDIINHVSKFFGYTPVLDKVLPAVQLDWPRCLKIIGCSDQLPLTDNDKKGIQHFVAQMLKGPNVVDPDFNDLHVQNRSYLAGLYPIREKSMRIRNNLYVFREPRSRSVDWCLGVTTAAAALLVIRLIVENPSHTLLTLTEPLLEMNVPFRTLLLLPDALLHQRRSASTEVSHFLYPRDYHFTLTDYEDYIGRVREFLSRPIGRAALTKGGLIAEIAQRYLGFDSVAEGPSSDVRLRYTGDLLDSDLEGFKYVDDCLIDQDVAILIGTYHVKTKQANQDSIVSWLPPPSAFYEQSKVNYWTYWSPVDGAMLKIIMDDIQAGRGQPKNKKDWRNWVRGRRGPAASLTPKFYDNLVERSEHFLESLFNTAS